MAKFKTGIGLLREEERRRCFWISLFGRFLGINDDTVNNTLKAKRIQLFVFQTSFFFIHMFGFSVGFMC